MEIPTTMRAGVLRGIRNLVLEDREVPSPAAGEALVRIDAAAVSGSDTKLYNTGRIVGSLLKQPLVLGRTAAGTIVSVGEGVPPQRIGERVAIEPLRICRHCEQCRHGRYNLCPSATFLGTPGTDGVFTEYISHPADFAHPVPAGLSDEGAAMVEPMSVALAALAKAATGAGSRLLISGAGPIGLIAVGVARALGAVEITITDLAEERLERATQMGATTTFNMARAGVVIPPAHFDAFIECSGSPAAIRRGFPGVRPAGHVVLVGRGADEVAVPLTLLQKRELTVFGSFRYANTFPVAIAMAASGRVPYAVIVGPRMPLGQLPTALEPSQAATGVKSIILPTAP